MGLASALAKGINGYTRGLQMKDEKERREKEDAWTQEERQHIRDARQRDAAMRAGLADAMKPAQVDAGQVVTDSAGSNAFTKDADAAAVMQDMAETKSGGAGLSAATRVNQSAYTDPTQAKAAADEYNSTGATLGRASAAVMPFDPAKGLQLRTGADQAQEAERVKRERIKTEGVVETVRSMRTGDPTAVKQAFNAGGEYKIDGDLTVKKEKRKAPWGEDVDTFTYTGTVVDAQGNKHPITRNSLDMMIQSIPFKDLFNTEAEAGQTRAKHGMTLAEIKARGSEDRQTAVVKERTTTSNNNPTREERLRYTTLFSEAGKRMSEAQQALNKLQSDPAFMVFANKPGSPQAMQLQGLQDSIKAYAEERTMYQGMLGNAVSAPAGGMGLSNAAPGNPNASERGLREKTSGGMGADPKAIQREIDASTLNLSQVSDPTERKMLEDHISNMQRQLTAIGGGQGKSAPSGGIVSVATKAERDALPKGTQYRDPKGHVYTKN